MSRLSPLIILSLVAAFLFSLSPIRLDDMFMYLALGRRLIANGEFGATDPYLFTVPAYAWDLWHEWLAYVYYYGVYQIGGYEGLIVSRALMVVAASTLVWRVCWIKGLSPLLTLAILGVSLGAASARVFHDRASFFSDLFTLLVLVLALEKRGKWFLPALFLLWVQLHPAYPIAWAVLGLFMLAYRRWDYAPVVGVCVLITILNPMGIEGALWPLQKGTSAGWQIFRQSNAEWMTTYSAYYLNSGYKVFVFAWMAVALALCARHARKTRDWFPLAVALLLTYFGCSATRFLALTGLGMGILVAHVASAKWQPRYALAATYTVCLLAIVGANFLERRGLPFLFSGQPRHPVVPVAAADFIRQLPPGNIFNEWDMGGFLIWELGERHKIAAHGFISDPDLAVKYYHRFSYSLKDWNEVIMGGNVDYFLLRRQTFEEDQTSSYLQALTEPAWKRIYVDGAAVLFQNCQRRPCL